MKVTPGVVIPGHFDVTPRTAKGKKYEDFPCNYIDDPKKTTKHYEDFVDAYIDDPTKTTKHYENHQSDPSNIRLFTDFSDRLTPEQKQNLSEQFALAQKNESPIWKYAISFTNEFLQETGILVGDYVDEAKLQEATRCGVKRLLENEEMKDSAVWAGGIHYNKPHIHVHLAIVEPHPTRERITLADGRQEYRGKFKRGTITQARSAITNNIYDRKEQLNQINEIIRNRLSADFKQYDLAEDRMLSKRLKEISRLLPADKRLWRYNMNALNEIRPLIDELSDTYIHLYHQQEYTDLLDQLVKQDKLNRALYGKPGKTHYSQTKINELHTRMGNTILNYIKKNPRLNDDFSQSDFKSKFAYKINHHASMNSLKKALRKNFESVKNERIHDELEQAIQSSVQYGKEEIHW